MEVSYAMADLNTLNTLRVGHGCRRTVEDEGTHRDRLNGGHEIRVWPGRFTTAVCCAIARVPCETTKHHNFQRTAVRRGESRRFLPHMLDGGTLQYPRCDPAMGRSQVALAALHFCADREKTCIAEYVNDDETHLNGGLGPTF